MRLQAPTLVSGPSGYAALRATTRLAPDRYHSEPAFGDSGSIPRFEVLALRSLWHRPADGKRNRATRKSDESTKDRRGNPKLEDRKPRCRRVDPEAHDEPHDAAQQARRNRTYRRPSKGQRPCAQWHLSHCPDRTSTPAGLGHRTVAEVPYRDSKRWPTRH